MKCSALNVDFNGVRFDPLGSRSPPYECIKFGYPLENVQFLLLSTNLAREWLQIYTDLLHFITSTADELSGGTNIDDLERPWTPKIGVLSDFFAILSCDAHLRVNFRWNILEIDQDNLRTKLNWCVSWALAQISCFHTHRPNVEYNAEMFVGRVMRGLHFHQPTEYVTA